MLAQLIALFGAALAASSALNVILEWLNAPKRSDKPIEVKVRHTDGSEITISRRMSEISPEAIDLILDDCEVGEPEEIAGK